MTAKPEMVPLYTTARGATMQIGNLGLATNTQGVLVPENQVKDLTAEKRLSTKPLPAEDEKAGSKSGKKE